VKEMKVVRVLFGLFCILSLIHAVRIEAQTLSEVEREHPERGRSEAALNKCGRELCSTQVPGYG